MTTAAVEEPPLTPQAVAREIARLDHASGNGNGAHTNGSKWPLRELFGDVPGITRPMTWDEYPNTPLERARYDIIDGWKVYYTWGEQNVPSPNPEHQIIALNISVAFHAYQIAARSGRALAAPCDVRIAQTPARSRQPDVMFLSRERWSQNAPANVYRPLHPAPELVVEIFSESDKRDLDEKIADYRRVDVKECWIVRPDGQTIEVLALSPDGESSIGIFGIGEAARSNAFPGLVVRVADVFADLGEDEG